MQVIKIDSMSGGYQYHVVLKDEGDHYLVDGGRSDEERAIWEYEWKLKYKMPFLNYKVNKESVVEE